jgi:alginate O-acetyltransferase complex protein AlgI
MIMQFKDLKNIKFENNLFYGGVLLFIIGLLKKIIIADNISIFVDSVFLYSKIDAPSLFSAWAGALGYMFQLYFDFSGYSDMALGISRMFRIEIPVNFYSPYKSTNIVIFWSRWHISLSNFLRDYIYIRLLGGNRGSNLFRFKNIIITMLLGGVWHGAGMNFILWGLFHGILIVMTHIYTMNEALKYVKSWAFIKITINMLILCFLWVLFRAENLTSLNNMIQGMLNFNGYTLPTIFCRSNCTERYIGLFTSPDLGGTLSVIPVLFCAIVITFYCNNSHQIYNEFIQSKKYQNKTYYYIIGIISGVILLSLNKPSTFLYYQF